MSPLLRKEKMRKQRELLERKRLARSSAGGGMLRKQSVAESSSPVPEPRRSSVSMAALGSQQSSLLHEDTEEIDEECGSLFDNSDLSDHDDVPAAKSVAEKKMKAMGIQPTFDPTTKVKRDDAHLDYSDMFAFLTRPYPKGKLMKCTIVRRKSGMRKMSPQYDMISDSDDRFLLCAKKRKRQKTSYYLISRSQEDPSKDNEFYMGKVRANFVGTEFVAYDSGVNPKDSTEQEA
eukprot:829825_1